MLNERLAVANEVASKLTEAELAIDLAIAKVGALLNHIPEAQKAAKLSPVVGNEAFGHLQSVVGSLFTGRSSMVAFHHELDHVKNQMGLRNFRVVGTGDAAKILQPNRARNDESEVAKAASHAA